jgi:type IV pilus assembly protein PilB
MRSRNQLGSILLRHGIISEIELNRALAHQKSHGGRLGEALLTQGCCTEVQVGRALADQLGMPFVDLVETPPTREALRELSGGTARKLGVVPAYKKDGVLVVVARNAFDFTIDAALRKAVPMPVSLVCGLESQIERILSQYDQLLIGPQTPPGAGSDLQHLSSRLGGRSAVHDIMRFQEDAPSPARVGELITGFLAKGVGAVELVLAHNTLRVVGIVEGRREVLAEMPAPEFTLLISAPKPGEGAPTAPPSPGSLMPSIR